MMEIRAWRDDHAGLVDSVDPMPPWVRDHPSDKHAIAMSMLVLHAGAMLLGGDDQMETR